MLGRITALVLISLILSGCEEAGDRARNAILIMLDHAANCHKYNSCNQRPLFPNAKHPSPEEEGIMEEMDKELGINPY